MTLIELLIVAAVLAVFIPCWSNLFIRIMQERARGKYQMEARADSHLVMEALLRDLSRQDYALAVNPPSGNSPESTDRAEGETRETEEPGKPLLALRFPGSRAARDGAKAYRVDYYLRGRNLVRERKPLDGELEDEDENEGEPLISQRLSNCVESLLVVRWGRILHVELTCARKPGKKRFASTVQTDFFIKDWAP